MGNDTELVPSGVREAEKNMAARAAAEAGRGRHGRRARYGDDCGVPAPGSRLSQIVHPLRRNVAPDPGGGQEPGAACRARSSWTDWILLSTGPTR